MSEARAIVGDYDTFLDMVFFDLAELNIDVSNFELDHMCYRVVTEEQYVKASQDLAEISELLSTVVIGGRKVSTYKLYKPILYKERSIALVELPEYKSVSKNTYPLGLEHVEFAIGKDADLAAFAAAYPHVAFETNELQKKHNPAIRIMLPNGHGSVKFHHLPLEEVIRLEKLETQVKVQ
jgi:predicted metalloenzyme YecM